MGQEAECRLTVGGKSGVGKAHLDSDVLLFSGELKLKIPFGQIREIGAERGELRLKFANGANGKATAETAVFELGPLAAKWAEKIRNPKSVIDKLGVKPEHKVSLWKLTDPALRADLAARCTDLSDKLRKDSDVIFAYIEDGETLAELSRLETYIKPNGMIWVIWPKGRKGFNGDHVFAAAKDQSLSGIKVCSVSEALSAVKVVIPAARR